MAASAQFGRRGGERGGRGRNRNGVKGSKMFWGASLARAPVAMAIKVAATSASSSETLLLTLRVGAALIGVKLETRMPP